MRSKTISALIEMGMPANIKGFHYIVESMCMFEKDSSFITGKTTILYKELSKMFNSTPSRVERAIRHAFSIVLTNGDLKVVQKYLTLQYKKNGNLLSTLYLRLSMEGQNEND